MKEIIEILKENNETLATMESCTGGGVANYITNFEDSSHILKFSAVTYSNEYKIKMGVDKKVIDEFTVYSMETAHEMAKNISIFAEADYGIGITGKLNRIDEANPYGNDSEVFISIYHDNKYYDATLFASKETREENKQMIIDLIIKNLKDVIYEKHKQNKIIY